MTRMPLALGLIASLAATPAMAFDPAAMSATERAAFGQAVRDYLMENPEVLVEAIGVLEQRQAAMETENDAALIRTHADAIFDDGHSWVGGNPDGDVTIVEFVDYRCGFCRRAHPEVEQLLSVDGEVRLIVKEFPILGEQSELSSRFAVAVQQLHGGDAYKAAHDALITFRGDVTLPALERLAEELGHEAGPVITRMNEPAVTDILRENRQLAERLRISGTPTFIMGDMMVRGYLPIDGMLELVDVVREGQG
jgi:protein-disulfide isomerase